MTKDTNYNTTKKPRSRMFLQLGMEFILTVFRIPLNADAAFPLVRHAASGDARARLNGRQQQTASGQTTDDMDLSMSFHAESSLGPGVPTDIAMDGKSSISLTETSLRTIVRLEAEYLVNQGSPGGDTFGTLSSVVEFTMPMQQVPVEITFNRVLHDPFLGAMTFVIDDLTTGVTLYQNDGSYPSVDDVLEASAGDRISIYTSMLLYGTVLAGAPGRLSWFDVTFEFKIVDCNGNGIYDPTDIANGTSTDCDGNGVPDECDLDCNHNGFGDVCDIQEGRSNDCDSNFFPDECDLSIGEATDCNANGIPDTCDLQSGALVDQNANNFPDSCEFETLYVDAIAPPGGNGSSWIMAYDDLQSALQHAANSAGIVKTTKVADGTYRPRRRLDPIDLRSSTFSLPAGMELLGGFTGLSDPIASRDPLTYTSTLDGDLAGDDTAGFGNRADNVYHVVSAIDIGNSGVLDGFTIRGGQADGSWPNGGAGLYLYESTPEVVRCKFAENFAGLVVPPRPPSSGYTVGCGGAIFYWTEEYVDVSPPEISIEESEFITNRALESGGAVCGEDVSFHFRNCVFRENQSGNGGAFGSGYSYSDPTVLFERCTFESNTAGYGGAIHAYSLNLCLQACTLTNNEASKGGGIYGWATLDILDTTFDSNIADDEGGGLYLYDGSIQLTGCRFAHNEATYGGGAIIRAFPATIMDCDFENNSAAVRGGGLHTLDSTILMESSHFTKNDAEDKGGGVISRGISTIHHCYFEGNSASQGGGLFHDGDTLLLTDSTFESNYAELGGGLGIGSLIGHGPVTIDRCELLNNDADQGGGLSAASYYGNLELRDSLIAQNYAGGYAGGLAGGGENLQISGCTISHNTAASLAGGMIAVQGATIENSVFWGNRVGPYYDPNVIIDETAQIEALHLAQVQYSTVQGWTGDFEGIVVSGDDPLFVNPILVDYKSIYDFRLRAGSPAINAGDPEFLPEVGESDLDGHARVLCGRVDMGAYESGIGDVNCDQSIDPSDFASWPTCSAVGSLSDGCGPLDFDNDGDVDLADFAAMQRLTWNP